MNSCDFFQVYFLLKSPICDATKFFSYIHNDLKHLENLLKAHRSNFKKVLIVTEGLFSMDGDVPDLTKLIELKNRYDSILMIDEAHSLGILGDNGKGLAELSNISTDSIDIIMGTLSKTLCSCGGYIAGKAELIEILKYYAPGFLYSVGMTPMNAAAAISTLDLMLENNIPVKKNQDISRYFWNKLMENGFNVGASIGLGIIPLITGGSRKAIILSEKLFTEYKINAIPIIYPAVEENMARLRFFMNCNHTHEQIDYTVNALKKSF